MIIYVHLIIFLQLLSCTSSFFESVHLKGFYNEEFLITCNIHSQIAIIKGVFRTIYNFRINIRSTLNKRCSGLSHCSYVFKKDHFGATKFKFGIIYINYYCISRKHIVKYCNQNLNIKESDLNSKEGFIQNPGYPHFYLMNWNCFWNIQTPNRLQFLKISIIDISLRDNSCSNSLSFIENNNTEYTTCESNDKIFSYKTQSSQVQIKFATKKHLNYSTKSTNLQIVPKRGFLIHYKVIGCIFEKIPKNAYLMSYNNKSALYICYVHHVFPDTKSRLKIVRCINENTWESNVPDCTHIHVVIRSIMSYKNYTLMESKITNGVTELQKDNYFIDFTLDIIIPSIIVIILFISSSIILFIIFKHRKRIEQFKENTIEQEMYTFPNSTKL